MKMKMKRLRKIMQEAGRDGRILPSQYVPEKAPYGRDERSGMPRTSPANHPENAAEAADLSAVTMADKMEAACDSIWADYVVEVEESGIVIHEMLDTLFEDVDEMMKLLGDNFKAELEVAADNQEDELMNAEDNGNL